MSAILKNLPEQGKMIDMEIIQSTPDHLIIGHAISPGVWCDDGFGAVWAAHKALDKDEMDVEYIEGIYGKAPDYTKIGSNTIVHILDFSYPVEILNVIGSRAKKVILLDHHKSAMERWEKEKSQYAFNDRDYIHFDMSKSGAMLAWDCYNIKDKDAPSLIEHIQDNDLWKFNLKATKDFINALRSYPQTLESWNNIYARTEETISYNEFVSEGRTISRYYNQKLDETIAATVEACIILDIKGFCCNAPKMFASDIGNILAKKSGTFGATWFKKSDGTIEWSLRSIGDTLDVSEVARQFGGGGHKNAAGFSLAQEDVGVHRFVENGIVLWRI